MRVGRALRGLAGLAAAVALLLAALAPLLRPGVAEAAVSIVRVTVSNVDDTSFTVTWVTNVPTGGHVTYGTTQGQLSGRADDFRGPDYVGYTHYVTVSGLLVDTQYYYAVVSGDTTQDRPSPGATAYNVKTGQTLTTIPDPAANFFFGTVFKADGVTPAEGVIVVVYVARLVNPGTAPQSTKLSALTDYNGEFGLEVSQARTTTSPQTYFSYGLSGDRVYYQVDGGWNNPPTSIPGNSGGWLWADTNTTSEGDNPTDVQVMLPNPDLLTPTATSPASPTATLTPTRTPGPPTATGTPTPVSTPRPAPTTPAPPTPAPQTTPSPAGPPPSAPQPTPAAPEPSPPGATPPAAVAPPTSRPAPPTATATPRPLVPVRPPVLTPRPGGAPVGSFAPRTPTAVPTAATATPLAPLPTPTLRPAPGGAPAEPPAAGVVAVLAVGALATAAGFGALTAGLVAAARRR